MPRRKRKVANWKTAVRALRAMGLSAKHIANLVLQPIGNVRNVAEGDIAENVTIAGYVVCPGCGGRVNIVPCVVCEIDAARAKERAERAKANG